MTSSVANLAFQWVIKSSENYCNNNSGNWSFPPIRQCDSLDLIALSIIVMWSGRLLPYTPCIMRVPSYGVENQYGFASPLFWIFNLLYSKILTLNGQILRLEVLTTIGNFLEKPARSQAGNANENQFVSCWSRLAGWRALYGSAGW